jgi:hypothetical protein
MPSFSLTAFAPTADVALPGALFLWNENQPRMLDSTALRCVRRREQRRRLRKNKGSLGEEES